MPRVFLCWLAALLGASWSGIALAERGTFVPWLPLVVGASAAAATALASARRRVACPRGAGWVAAFALCATITLLPAVDTTLISQDASLHLATGRWLGRSGSLAVPDPSLEGVSESTRLGLFAVGAMGTRRLSVARLPGGLVLPGHMESAAYPSFAHLLAVWVAMADWIGGRAAIDLLGPLFAATAWWAIGLTALHQGTLAGALASVALLATWLPEHWFARFLMPEVATQALLWAGVAAWWLAGGAAPRTVAPDRRGPAGAPGSAVAGILAGAALGVAGFARFEQLSILVPALLLARAVLPWERRVLPRFALIPFLLAFVHAALHVVVVPTDYGKRMSKVINGAIPVLWSALGATPRSVGWSLALLLLLLGLCGLLLRRWRRGAFTRLIAGLVGVALYATILGDGLPEKLPALRWLSWYVPWPAWIAAISGVLPLGAPSGIGLALGFEALDQVLNPRVTEEQIWGARRLVTVVLPLVALAAGWAIARCDVARSRRRARLAVALVALAIGAGAVRLAPLLGRPIQAGGAALAEEIAAALPPGSTVVLAQPLDWLHLAPVLWLDHGHVPVVVRDHEAFPCALAWYLEQRAPADELYLLAGGMGAPGEAIDPATLLPPLPAGLAVEPVRSFRWTTRALERTSERRPERLAEQRAELGLFRLRRTDR